MTPSITAVGFTLNQEKSDLVNSKLKRIAYADDLIVSSACLASKLSRESDYNKCLEYVYEYKSIFPHFYLELQDINLRVFVFSLLFHQCA